VVIKEADMKKRKGGAIGKNEMELTSREVHRRGTRAEAELGQGYLFITCSLPYFDPFSLLDIFIDVLE